MTTGFFFIDPSQLYIYVSFPHAKKTHDDKLLWGTVPSVGNVAQPPLGKASGEQDYLVLRI